MPNIWRRNILQSNLAYWTPHVELFRIQKWGYFRCEAYHTAQIKTGVRSLLCVTIALQYVWVGTTRITRVRSVSCRGCSVGSWLRRTSLTIFYYILIQDIMPNWGKGWYENEYKRSAAASSSRHIEVKLMFFLRISKKELGVKRHAARSNFSMAKISLWRKYWPLLL